MDCVCNVLDTNNIVCISFTMVKYHIVINVLDTNNIVVINDLVLLFRTRVYKT